MNTQNINVISLKGVRKTNEDCHTIITNLNNTDKTKAPINFIGVYDGHGGDFVSKFLSESLYTLFIDKRITYPISKDYINQVFKYLQHKILKKNFYDRAEHCGSTCLVGIHYKSNDQDFLNIMNVGDTRCVLCRDNFAIPLSKDHKPMWPEEKHRIESLGGKIYLDNGGDWRIGDLSVSRAFGDFDAEPYLTNMPDIFRYKLEKNDKFVIFACDGLWDVMDNQDSVNFILNECYDKENKRINTNINVAKKLADYALKKGSLDNLTIVVYFL